MKKRVLSLALCLVLVVGLFSGLTVNASAGRLDDLKKEIAEKLIKEKIEQLKEEFEIPDLDTDAILSSFTTTATEGNFGENSCLHWEVSTGVRRQIYADHLRHRGHARLRLPQRQPRTVVEL
mgnify:CR=1 FL=1